MGAHSAIGSLMDVPFLTETFIDADAVYCMKPPQQFVDFKMGFFPFYRMISENYVNALQNSRVKHVVHLSSIGAHTDKGMGLLKFHYEAEAIFNSLSPEVADELNLSSGYLSDLLKSLTGLTTQQHIHEKLINKAKEKLSTTELTVSEIAYDLGFEHLQSFSKLFKAKTNFSPLAFRQSFN